MHNEYYEILGVTADDNEEYISQRYRELSQLWHPDKCAKSDICSDERKQIFTEQQRKINEAYSALKMLARKGGSKTKTQSYSQREQRNSRKHSAEHHDRPSGETQWPHVDKNIVNRIIYFLSAYMLLKVILAECRHVFTSDRIGVGLSVSSSLLLLHLFNESEHIDTVMWCISPLYAYYIYVVIKDVFDRLLSIFSAMRPYWFALISLPVAYALLQNGFPKITAILMWLIIVFHWKTFDFRMLLLSGACIWYVSSTSTPGAPPMHELSVEIAMCRLYTYVFVLVDMLQDRTIQSLSAPLYRCLKKGNCSSAYMSQLAQSILDESPKRFLAVCTQYIPHMLILVAAWSVGAMVLGGITSYLHSWQQWMVQRFSRSSAGGLVHGSAFRQESPERTTESEGTLASADSSDSNIFNKHVEEVMAAVSGLSRPDAARFLMGRNGDVAGTISFLLSPAGKASRAAQRRQKHTATSSKSSMSSKRPRSGPPSFRI